MLEKKNILLQHKNLLDVAQVAKEVIPFCGPDFCIWLQGPVGSGKTTLTSYILRELGLPPNIPVTSPTFTLVNEYLIQGKCYAHLDMYRLTEQSSLSDILDFTRYDGYFIEWPENINRKGTPLEPTAMIEIHANGTDTRNYRIYDVS